jgi:hypothetical protein
MKNDEHISAMVGRLREFHEAEGNERLTNTALHWIEDPLKPRTADGNLRLSPILVFLVVLAVLAAATFLAFSLVRL